MSYLLGATLGSLVIILAISIIVSIVVRRFLSPRTMVAVSVLVGFLCGAALMVFSPKGGDPDWSGLLPAVIAAVIIAGIWYWRLTLRKTDSING